MEIFKRIGHNLRWAVIGAATGKALMFFSGIYLARVLGASSFGVLSYAMNIVTLVYLFADFGSGMYGVRAIARDRLEFQEIADELISIRVSNGILVFIVYVIILTSAKLYGDANDNAVWLMCGAYIITYAIYPEWVARGLERFKLLFLSDSIIALFYLAGLFVFVRSSDSTVAGALVWSLSYIPGSIYLYYALRREIQNPIKLGFKMNRLSPHFDGMRPIFLSGIFLVLYRYVPIVILGIFCASVEVGMYSAAYRIVFFICGIGLLFSNVSYPVLCDLRKRDYGIFYRDLRRLNLAAAFIGGLVCLFAYVWAGNILLLLLGSGYDESIIIFKVMILALPFYFTRVILGVALFAMGMQRYHNYSSILGAFVSLTASLLMIPDSGAYGAAKAIMLGEAAIAISMMIMVVVVRNMELRESGGCS